MISTVNAGDKTINRPIHTASKTKNKPCIKERAMHTAFRQRDVGLVTIFKTNTSYSKKFIIGPETSFVFTKYLLLVRPSASKG